MATRDEIDMKLRAYVKSHCARRQPGTADAGCEDPVWQLTGQSWSIVIRQRRSQAMW